MIELPEYLRSLVDFLCEEREYSLEEEREFGSFDDYILVLASSPLRVRIVRDRGLWNLEVASVQRTNQWYSVGLVYKILCPGDVTDLPPVEEEAQLLANEYDKFRNLFAYAEYAETEKKLDQLQQAWARRTFPGWFRDRE